MSHHCCLGHQQKRTFSDVQSEAIVVHVLCWDGNLYTKLKSQPEGFS